MKKILFILLSFGLAAEMEVDGNLKVTGTVDASGNPITNVGAPLLSTDAVNAETLASVLSDDAIYEYLLYQVKIGTNNPLLNAEWILLDVGVESWSNNFTTELNIRALEGYEIHSMMNLPWNTYSTGQFSNCGGGCGGWAAPHADNLSFTLFILKRPIAEE